MGKVIQVLGGITGMSQDYARELMPSGRVWSLLDLLPQSVGANARSRNGWVVGNTLPSGYKADSGVFHYSPTGGGGKALFVTSNDTTHKLHEYTGSGGAATDTGLAMHRALQQNPFQFREKIIVPPLLGGLSKIVTVVGGYSVADLPASSFQGAYGCAYKDRVVLAASSAEPTVVGFSKPGDPTLAWDSLSKIGTSLPVEGLFPLRNSVLVYHESSIERIRGDTPPDSSLSDPTGNMLVEPFPTKVGLHDAMSISPWQDGVVWADERGVFWTDGAATVNLAQKGGMELAWLSIFDLGVGRIAGCCVGDFYVVTLSLADGMSYTQVGIEESGGPHIEGYPGGAGENLVTFIIDLPSRTWSRVSNFQPNCYVAARLAHQEALLYGDCNVNRLVNATDAVFPTYQSALTGTDGDGYDFRPIIETPWFSLDNPGTDRIHNAYISYELRSLQADTTVVVEIAGMLSGDPPSMSYIRLAKELPVHNGIKRMRVPIRKGTEGISFRLTVDGEFSFFNLFGIELETHAMSKTSVSRA